MLNVLQDVFASFERHEVRTAAWLAVGAGSGTALKRDTRHAADGSNAVQFHDLLGVVDSAPSKRFWGDRLDAPAEAQELLPGCLERLER